MEAPLILAGQILDFIRNSGSNKRTAYTARSVATKILAEVHDITFDSREAEEAPASCLER
jgi:hypothetical protein